MIGDLIAERYELLELVGTGGMSSVYKAHDQLLERNVALKVLHPHYGGDEEYVERFRREARAVAQLSHPNIVTVIDRGEHDDRQFIVFEFIDGENLKELVNRTGPLPARRAVELAIAIAEALAFAHAHGLVHRDVKPQNVLLNWVEFDGAIGGDGGDGSASVVLAPIWEKGTDSDKLSRWLTGVRARREAAERKRVFYVATTRAREELHLFGAIALTVKGELARPRYDSLLGACWPAAHVHFEAATARSSAEEEQFIGSLSEDEAGDETGDEELALAASGEGESTSGAMPAMIQRLPLSYIPKERFRSAADHRLEYPVASALRQTAVFERPEGSFAVRAFGNVVHRYLQMLVVRLERGGTCEDLISELPTWEPRLIASLRGEGLPPALVAREAIRAGRALSLALGDPVGRWILSPREAAASERALTMGSPDARSLRVDRTFLAGDEPMSLGNGCIWIVDFKTTERGSRSVAEFEAAEVAKYRAQLEAYATLRRAMPDGHLPIRLGLFYPLVPRFIHWLSDASGAATLS